MILARWHLHPRLSNVYANHSVTIQISDERHRIYVMGVYVHHDSPWVATSIKEEIKQIISNFIEPRIVLAATSMIPSTQSTEDEEATDAFT